MAWIFYPSPEYRGRRHGKILSDCACERAFKKGFTAIDLKPDAVGLYKKYGFIYVENRFDIYGEYSRVYKKNYPYKEKENAS